MLLTFIFGGAGGGEHENVLVTRQTDCLVNSAGQRDMEADACGMYEIPRMLVSEIVNFSEAVDP